MPALSPERVHKVARPEATSRPHVPALDGVRGIAIIAVVAFHIAVVVSANAPWAYNASPPVYAWPLFAGSLGVDLFFVLSGLLVYRSWQSLRVRYRDEGIRTVVEFARRRGRRLIPPYWFALTLLIPLRAPEWLETLHGWRNIAMFASLNQFVDTDLPRRLSTVTWSLTTEAHFYLLLPIIAVALARFGWRAALPALIATSVLWRFSTGGTGAEAEWIVGRIDQFAAGIAAAALVAEHQAGRSSAALRWLTSRRTGWVLGAGLLMLALAHGALRLLPKPLFFLATLHTLVALAIAGLLVRVLCLGRSRFLRSRVLVWFGLISYSLYLWHWPLIAEGAKRWGATAPVIVAAVGVASVVSVISYLLLERPFLRPSTSEEPERDPVTASRPEYQPAS